MNRIPQIMLSGLAALSLSAAPVFAQGATPPAGASDALKAAMDAVKKSDFATAKTELQKVLDASPDNADANAWFGFSLLKDAVPDPDGAVTYLEKANKLKPDTPTTLTNLGNALLLKKTRTADDSRRAREVFEQVTKLTPSNAEAWFNLGYSSGRIADTAGSVSAYRKAVEIDPKFVRAQINLGLALQKLGKLEDAATALRAGAAESPSDSGTWASLGALELKLGNRQEAIDALLTALKIDSANYTALVNLAKAQTDANKTADAAISWGKVADLAEAGTVPAGVVASDPSARFNQAFLLAKTGRINDAIANYEKALVVKPRYFDALINVGVLYFKQAKWDDAIKRFSTAAEVDPNAGLAWANLGAACKKKNDVTGAISAWRKAVAIDPKDFATRGFLANSLMDKGDLRGAIAVFTEMAALQPTKAEPLVAAGNAYQKLENLDMAFKMFQRATQRNPRSAAAWNNLGVVFERRGQISEAIASFKKSLAADPTFGPAKQNLNRYPAAQRG